MMKLYFSPGACSLSPHIVLREAGVPFDLEQVDLRAKTTKSGADYKAINPKGAVPALQLEGGDVLTEGAVIVQYIADKKPESKLAPPTGTIERYRLQEWLNFIASEVHKSFSPLFNPKASPDTKELFVANIGAKLDYVAKELDGKSFLMGDAFSVADAYLFTVLRWTKPMQIELSKWPTLAAYFERVAARPAVKAALAAESPTQK
jgi:glutathione S-transferase